MEIYFDVILSVKHSRSGQLYGRKGEMDARGESAPDTSSGLRVAVTERRRCSTTPFSGVLADHSFRATTQGELDQQEALDERFLASRTRLPVTEGAFDECLQRQAADY